MTEEKIYHVGDTGLVEGVALGRTSVVLLADFERVKAERDALQQRLNVTDQQNDELANKMQCQFPQSCTTRCDCDIPDFSPGNGNKARRRAELLGFKIAEDPTLAPNEMKLVAPTAYDGFDNGSD